MKRIIPFVNDIEFSTSIKEITSIALEHNLKMENDDSVVGELIVSGNYLKNDVSMNEDSFEKTLNFDITLDDKYDSKKVKIDIDDFYYEIVDDKYLKVHIDVVVNNLFYKEEKIEVRQENDSIKEEVKDNLYENYLRSDKMNEKIESKKEIIEEKKEDTKIKAIDESKIINDNLIFSNDSEIYVCYKVHIIRDNQTINDIIDMYNTTKEELEKYNDIENIKIGTKIVIPYNFND